MLNTKKGVWLLGLVTSLPLFLTALIFQHCLDMPPCVLCIHQRVALLGIGLAMAVPLLAPNGQCIRAASWVLWIYSAFKGLTTAWEQMQRYLHPDQFIICPFRVDFPEWLPLDEWLPAVFKAYSACEPLGWSLLGLNLPQWMVLLFALHLIAAIGVIVSQAARWH